MKKKTRKLLTVLAWALGTLGFITNIVTLWSYNWKLEYGQVTTLGYWAFVIGTVSIIAGGLLDVILFITD